MYCQQFFIPCHQILQKTESKGALYLGNLISAKDSKFLKENNIKAVLTAAAGLNARLTNLTIKHKIMNIWDVEQYQISKHFDESYKFIEENLKYGAVLVHCAAGISRSATIVIAYLMKKFDWSFDQTYRFVRQKRKIVSPNPGFVRQLRYYQQKISKEYSCDIQKRELADYQIEATQNRSIQINSISGLVNKKNILLTGRSIMNSNQIIKPLSSSQQDKKLKQLSFQITKTRKEETDKKQKKQLIFSANQSLKRNPKMFMLTKNRYSIGNFRLSANDKNKLKVC